MVAHNCDGHRRLILMVTRIRKPRLQSEDVLDHSTYYRALEVDSWTKIYAFKL